MAKKNTGLVATEEVDSSKVDVIQTRICDSAGHIESIVNKLVSEYCQPLDEYMTFIRKVVSDETNPPSDLELDDFTLNLPVLMYFTGEAQEALGIKEDVAKAIRQEVYNEAYNLAVGTVGDKASVAELTAQTETIIHIAYQRAYKKVKLRMESANEMLQSVKKVISRRMVEYEVNRVDTGRTAD